MGRHYAAATNPGRHEAVAVTPLGAETLAGIPMSGSSPVGPSDGQITAVETARLYHAKELPCSQIAMNDYLGWK
jgi:hypothetical protein